MDTFFSSHSPELWFTAIAASLAMAAVALPFWRGLGVVLSAHSLTSRGADGHPSVIDTIVDDVVAEAMRTPENAMPFVRDAAKQYVLHEYAANYERRLSMFANLLPPVGFIGTTLGLVVLFASMQWSQAALEVGAIGLALSSTLFALAGYATLESLRIALYGRLIRRIDEALSGSGREATVATGGESSQPA